MAYVPTLEQFVEQYSTRFPPFPDLPSTSRELLINQANDILRQHSAASEQTLVKHALACLRILSRDKDHLGRLTSPETIALLLKHAELCHNHKNELTNSLNDASEQFGVPENTQAAIDSEKVLHNLLLQSPDVRGEVSNVECINALIARLNVARNNPDEKLVPYDLVFFDLRILFLITALTPSTRSILRYDLNAAKVLYDLLHLHLDRGRKLSASEQHDDEVVVERVVSDRDADLLVEIAKLIYNITITLERYKPTDEETMIAVTLVKTVRKLLLTKAESDDRTQRLRSQAVNLLTGVPRNSYRYLVEMITKRVTDDDISSNSISTSANADAESTKTIVEHAVARKQLEQQEELARVLQEQTFNDDNKTTNPVKVEIESSMTTKHDVIDTLHLHHEHSKVEQAEQSTATHKIVDFLGHDMNPVVMLLNILQTNLDSCSRRSTQTHTQETLVPILTCLCEAGRSSRIIRKFLKVEILPPLSREALQQRPEVGDALRNKLCSLMTSPVMEVKMLSAELLFILCKESVARFVRYVGYGNAAGLLAGRGLMAPQKAVEQELRSANAYSDDEDSDTEAYDELRERINPILGCVEDDTASRVDPMADMTEEEKEFEAMKLVDILDKMARRGIVQPMFIGADGRPQPVEHVLELRDAAAAAATVVVISGTTNGSSFYRSVLCSVFVEESIEKK